MKLHNLTWTKIFQAYFKVARVTTTLAFAVAPLYMYFEISGPRM